MCSYNPETGRSEDAWIWKDLLGENFTASVRRVEKSAPHSKNPICLSELF